jgi:hypothetical protein
MGQIIPSLLGWIIFKRYRLLSFIVSYRSIRSVDEENSMNKQVFKFIFVAFLKMCCTTHSIVATSQIGCCRLKYLISSNLSFNEKLKKEIKIGLMNVYLLVFVVFFGIRFVFFGVLIVSSNHRTILERGPPTK